MICLMDYDMMIRFNRSIGPERFKTRQVISLNLASPYFWHVVFVPQISLFHIFWPFFPSHATQLKTATYFDSLQFIGEVKQKVNKLHMLAKKVLPCFPCILWRKIFFANLITLPRHNMDQLQISHNAIFSGGVGCSARMEGDHLYSPTKWRGWYP